MKRIRGGRGLGDTIYLRPIVQRLIADGEQVTVCCDHPEVFIGTSATVVPFERQRIDILAHYTTGKQRRDTNQWDDICNSAGIHVPLRFQWEIQSPAFVQRIRDQAAGRPLVLVHGGRVPMGRTDGFGMELLPAQPVFEAVLREVKATTGAFLVRIGKGADLYPLPVDTDLNGQTTVSDLLDLASACDGVIGQCSFAIPLAEVFDKPLLAVWSHRGLEARCHYYIQTITPKKVLSKPTSTHVMDDWPAENIRQIANGFMQARQ